MITQATPLTCLDAALNYYDMGWSVVPAKTTGGKHPALASWKEYQRKRLSPADLREFWRERPGLNVGMITGEVSNASVVDLDGIHAPGLMKAQRVTPPKTRAHKTPNGWHLVFQHNSLFQTESKNLIAGPDICQCTRDGKPHPCAVDVRSDGGFLMLPPSVYGGKAYTVAYDYEIAEWPDPPDFLRGKKENKKASAPRQRTISPTLYASTPYGRIKAAVTVSEVAAILGVQLAPKGNTEVGLCPLHSENTPSFTVYPDQDEGSGSWYCYGCTTGGDVITLLELSGRLDTFMEATR